LGVTVFNATLNNISVINGAGYFYLNNGNEQ
jgi:hypothetical protein